MGRRFSFSIDDEASELVQRYEQYLAGIAPGYFDVHEMERIVEYYLSSGRTNESLSALELGQKLHPGSSLLDVKRAKIYLSTGNVKKSYRILSGLLEDSDPEVIVLKIEALIKLQRVQEANELAQALLKEEHDDFDWVCADLALTFMAENEFESAIEILATGNRFNPKNAELLFDMAFCYEQKTMFDDAINTYQRILDIDPYYSEAWFNLGQIHFLQQNFEQALEAYDYVLAINDTDSLALYQKAHSHFQLNQWKEALESYLNYEMQVSDKWQVWLFIGETFEKLEDYTNALYYYQLSFLETPENYEALIGISVSLLELQRFEESLGYIEKALEINSEMADAWVYMGEAQLELGDMDKSLKAYHQAISIEPNQPDTLLAIGNIYMDQADFVNALNYYKLAYSFDQTLEFIELFIAVASFYLENYEDMAVYLEMAVQRNLDAATLFVELCPEAVEFLKKKK